MHRKPLQPIYADEVALSWSSVGDRVRIDSALQDHLDSIVYRYGSLAECLSLCSGNVAFSSPKLWPDKYEQHIVDSLFGPGTPFEFASPFVKCLSLEHSSEAIWKTHFGRGGLVRLKFKLSELISALNSATWPGKGKVYIGRVRYMTQPQIRKAIESLSKNVKLKKTSGNAMRALLMKRGGFSFENEIRIAYLPISAKRASTTISAGNLASTLINEVLIDPYLAPWQAVELTRLLKNHLGMPFPVKQSLFDTHPSEFA